MTTPAEFTDAVFGAFNTFWASRTPVSYPNLNFDPTAAGSGPTAAWAQVDINEDDGIRRYGYGATEILGTIVITVYVYRGAGTERSRELLGDAMDFLRQSQIPDVLLNNLRPFTFGASGAWYREQAAADFRYFRIEG